MRYRHYIGMDAHSTTCAFAVMNSTGKVVRRARVATRESDLVEFIDSLTGSKALTFEETMVSQWLYILLNNKVDKLIVCNPAAIVKTSKAKTDFKDAIELADLLRVNRLQAVYHSCDKLMELRTLISGYEDVVQELTRAKNRYSALFRRTAQKLANSKAYSDKSNIKRLASPHERFVAKQLFEQIDTLGHQKEKYQKQFEATVPVNVTDTPTKIL